MKSVSADALITVNLFLISEHAHHWWNPPIQAGRCAELLQDKPNAVPRQCKKRPMAGSAKCRYHDAQTRSNRTAEKQDRLDDMMTNQRNLLAVRRQEERDTIRNNRRFGFRPE